ncbi:phosphate/phosphite/phosphonate ABC transporter substrate-binding protein [Acholeplasma equirhinis]|uniref:phosphate/phosphite/phosphonate ABC transporter substrate-binding protein n=1 Tax=Acholeplasma equirhinis TaxID=555393 RepID=UPI00197AF1DE|nr:phosphate/phosphite/phosphonate ABC transporter substrate-binding protein [Acholeplasma equirhinis]MBN3489944.1 phosphate/phosphite/phosphonate ABC transporter substrate-binding protein [Acholeplasma equirhinis]
MKKIVLLLVAVLATVLLVACGEASVDPDEIVVAFVPSNSASAVITRATELEELLEERVPGKSFKVILGTDYDAVVEGMLAGTIHVGFLTGQQYAGVSVEYPGKVEVVLTSVRKGFAAQFDANGNLVSQQQLLENMAAENYTGQLSDRDITFYHSILIVRKDSGINTLEDLKGKTVGTQATSSGSGFVYPAVLLHQNGMKFVSGDPDSTKGEVKYQTINGHPSAAIAVFNKDVDAAFTFMDARSNVVAEYPDIFAETKVIALTPGVYNDTISVVSNLKAELKTAIQEAFLDIIGTEQGLSILSVYSHTGYLKSKDEDYAGEREVYIFKRDNLS